MIERVRGRVEERGVDWVVVGMGPVSLRVNTTGSTLNALGEQDAAVTLLTHLYIREDIMALYGFGSREEREVFLRLIGVSGVGPRAAQLMLTVLSPDAVYEAIEGEKIDALTRVPGIGRKTAQRVILELKGKLVDLGPSGGDAASAGAPPTPSTSGDNELAAVLVGLGYSAAEAVEALRSVPPQGGLSDEDRLRAALRYFATS
jgi:Holliday junction DNA helicase RuvA